MNCVHCGAELDGKHKRTCSARCRRNASGYRLYYWRKLHDPEVAASKADIEVLDDDRLEMEKLERE